MIAGAAASEKISPTDMDDIAPLFDGYDGTFVLLDTKTGQWQRYNADRAARRFAPCSTFKIFNSLVGLETGVLSGKEHLMHWDGTKYDIASWNQDQTLQSAITNSVVWYFQRVAEMIGVDRMHKYLAQVGYGNEDMSGGLTHFWLGSTLKISANEQVLFLERLVKNRLPFSKSTTDTVKELTALETTERGTLHGKTGSDKRSGHNVLGWFVGYCEQPDDVYVFAANISAPDGAWGKRARAIAEAVLKQRGIL
jgi:beta-lactamase class D